uniref:Pecanex-like protein n=1 Tax=Schistocephalus solidus TaxID=70667 RepID=A0A183SAR9_SCHSO
LAAAAVLHPVAAGLISPSGSLQQAEMAVASSLNYTPKTTLAPVCSEAPRSIDALAFADIQDRKLNRVKRSPGEEQQRQQSPMEASEGKRVRPTNESPHYNLSFEAATAQKLSTMELQQRQPPGFSLNGEADENHKAVAAERRHSVYHSQSSLAAIAERNRLLEAGLGLQNMHVSLEKNGILGSSSVSGDGHPHRHQQNRKSPPHGYPDEQSSRHLLNAFTRSSKSSGRGWGREDGLSLQEPVLGPEARALDRRFSRFF